MQEKFSKILLRCIVMFISCTKYAFVAEREGECGDIAIKNGLKHISCQGSFQFFPSNLDSETQSITLQSCTIDNVGANSFVKYKKLITLKIIKSWMKYSYDRNYLIIPSLRKLELDSSVLPYLKHDKVPEFPSNLIELNITNHRFNLKAFNAKKYEHLSHLNLFKSGIERLPSFSEFPAIQYINLDENPVNFTVEDIMALCRLKGLYANKYVYLNVTAVPTRTYCECNRLISWMKSHQIKTNIQQCSIKEKPISQCNLKMNDWAVKKYKACLKKAPTTDSYTSHIIYFLISAFLVFSIILTSIYYVVFYEEKKIREEETVESEWEEITNEEVQEEQLHES